MTRCAICQKPLDVRHDVRWTLRDGTVLCSTGCLWKYRGKERCV